MINSNTEYFTFDCVIYALLCPIEKEVRYIGKTKQTLKRRLSTHIRQNSNCKKSIWIKELIKNGLKPEIILIEICNNKNWKQREIYHITIYDNLLNENKGRAGGESTTNMYLHTSHTTISKIQSPLNNIKL